MAESHWHDDPEGAFSVRLPEGWSAEDDPEEGGVVLWHPVGYGMLHLLSFPAPTDEVADPAEELYAFLEDQGVELEEDEVEDVELAGGGELALCEYISEEEDEAGESEAIFWMMGVATAPGVLVFATYNCPAEMEVDDRELIRSTLAALRLRGAEPPQPQ